MHQIALFKKFLGGACPRTPVAKRGAKRDTSRKRDVYSPQYYPPHI